MMELNIVVEKSEILKRQMDVIKKITDMVVGDGLSKGVMFMGKCEG